MLNGAGPVAGVSESQEPPVALASSAILPASSDQAAQSPDRGNDSATADKVLPVLTGAQVRMLPAPSPDPSPPAQPNSRASTEIVLF